VERPERQGGIALLARLATNLPVGVVRHDWRTVPGLPIASAMAWYLRGATGRAGCAPTAAT